MQNEGGADKNPISDQTWFGSSELSSSLARVLDRPSSACSSQVQKESCQTSLARIPQPLVSKQVPLSNCLSIDAPYPVRWLQTPSYPCCIQS